MGKFKRRLRKSTRFCPILPKVTSGYHSNSQLRQKSSCENCLSDDSSPQKGEDGPSTLSLNGFKSAVAKISSHYSEDRLCAIKLFMSLPTNKKNLKKFQDYNCVDSVSLLMVDSYTRLQATLFISKLLHSDSFTINESVANCILKSLCPVLKLFKDEELYVRSVDMVRDNKIKPQALEKSQSFIASVQILSKLCEHNQSVVATVNNEGIIPMLLKFANPNQFGYSISLAILQCLLCVTETNEAASACLSTDHLMGLISCQPENYRQIYFSVLVAGVLVNIGSSGINLINPVFNLISHTIDIDVISICNKVPLLNNSELIEELDGLLSAQKLALEIITNICYIDDNSSCDGDYNSEMLMDVEISQSSDDDLSLVKNALQEYKIVDKVLAEAALSLDNVPNIEGMGKPIRRKFKCIKIRAVSCLINLSGFIDCSDSGGSEQLFNIFSHLGNILLSAHIKDQTLLEELSAAMRTVVENLCEGKCQLLCNVSLDDMQNILDNAKNSRMKTDLTHVVGSLCCFFVENLPENDIYNEKQLSFFIALTNHLLQMASESPELWVCAEALDIIIDVFSDDKTDRLAAQLNLVDSLKTIQRSFMVQFKKQRKKLGEHWPLIETVTDNLMNFIEHKTTRIANNNRLFS